METYGREVMKVVAGETYRFHWLATKSIDGSRFVTDLDMLLYKVLGFVLNCTTMHEMVLYQGVEGRDAGKMFVCTLYDFAIKFRHEPQEEADEGVPEGDPLPPQGPPPEKSAGVVSGSDF